MSGVQSVRLSRRTAIGELTGGAAWIAIAGPVMAKAPPSGFIDVRAFGAKGDGIADDTQALTRAHAMDKPVYYPRPAAFYRLSAPLRVTNSVHGDGARIRLAQNGMATTDILIVLANPRPLSISGLVLDGGYQPGRPAEESKGIALSGARDVTVAGNTIANTCGDCIHLGRRKGGTDGCENIRLVGNVLDNPGRCNVAVTHAHNVEITGNRIAQVRDYVAAIDLEPDADGSSSVRDVRIMDNRFSVPGSFLAITKSNRAATSAIEVRGNTGSAACLSRINASARAEKVVFTGNAFRSNGQPGSMFAWQGVRQAILRRNVDRTPCVPGRLYRSLTVTDSEVSIEPGNVFCG